MDRKGISNGITRRQMLKIGGLAAAGAAGASVLGGCAPKSAANETDGAFSGGAGVDGASATPSFLAKPEPIAEFAETKEYEVVVVGCGAAGMSAALSAAEAGARIACVQKESIPSSQGNMAAAVDLGRTSEAGKQALISYLTVLSQHRSDRSLLEAWADNSFEAISWFKERASQSGMEVNENEPQADRVLSIHGYDVYLHANTYFGTGHGEVVKAMAPLAEESGVEFFFETPAVQLALDDGRVTGVVCEQDGKHILFNASKGVILATGDYQNDEEMIAYYCPDLKEFPPNQMNRTGDGHKMGVWAGGEIEPPVHTKMIHDARVGRVDTPHMVVNYRGERFMCEGPMQGYLNNYVREYIHREGTSQAGNVYTVCDAKWQDQIAEWKAIDPEIDASNCAWYYEGATVEEACRAMADDEQNGYEVDAQAVAAAVRRYNELCAAGADEDFGKDPVFMRAIDTPPFIIVPHEYGLGLSAVIGGLLVNADNQVLKADEHTPIEGLYAVGNVSGPFYGGVDYPMDVLGLSIGRAITGGYLAGRHVAGL
ncbi:FAD-dependent oxidoreductase [Gordonibacter sp. An230]|uniref:FAD-dependent oxidoreductase n=1 Tax=Gordonibacter sp. An230 TaxID=1965592 RepID=UPI0013A62A93|nr:FAD-dependent oxidoreductase [Gordonibacter sp. An230]